MKLAFHALCLTYFRLRASESVQYFQFDQSGNMFVFGPGAGFSGPSLKVEPGFEMSETSQENLFQSHLNESAQGETSEVSAVKCEVSSEKSQGISNSTGIKRFLAINISCLECS